MSAGHSIGHSHFTQVAGLRTHAWVQGQGRPLVIVPGLGCASWMYKRVTHELAKERQVYVYDPPGHGYSEGTWHTPTTLTHLIDHLALWLEQMGLRRAPLFGHSLGGEIVLNLAALYPRTTTAIIACAPTGIPENPDVTTQLLRLLLDLPLERPGLLPAGFAAYSTAGMRRMYLLAHDQSRHHTGPLLPRIQAPTLLLNAGRDPVIHDWTVEEIQHDVPDSLVKVIAGGTHALTDSHPRAVARYTLDFLHLIEVEQADDWAEQLG